MLKWFSSPEISKRLVIADHRIPSKCRGTWCHRKGEWYELDYYIVSKEYVGRFGGLRTWAVGESDHAARSLRFRLAKNPVEKASKPAQFWGPKTQAFDLGGYKERKSGLLIARRWPKR